MTDKTHMIKIGGKQWLVGMYWHSFEYRPSKEEIKENIDIISDSRGEAMSSVAVRIEAEAIQIGFAPQMEKVKGGVYSLAAAIAGLRGQPWLGMYQLDEDTWWYIAVRDNQSILPDGDVVGNLDDVIRARENHSGYDDWNYVDGTLADLEEMIDKVKKPVPIVRRLSMPTWLPHAIAIGSLILAGVVGGGLWINHDAKIKAEAAAIAKAKLMESLSTQPPKDLPSPLLKMPLPNAMMDKCQNVLASTPLSYHGWMLGDISCTPMSAEILWNRSSGATVAERPDGYLDDSGDSVTQSFPFNLGSSGPDNSISLNEEKDMLFAALQPLGVQVQITSVKSPVALPGESSDDKAPRPKPSSVFSVTLPVPPMSMNWNAIPGLRIDRVSTSSNGWTVEGIMYGK